MSYKELKSVEKFLRASNLGFENEFSAFQYFSFNRAPEKNLTNIDTL